MELTDLKDRKILIVGFGREGLDSFLFLRKKFPDKSLGIADQKEFAELPSDTQKLLKQDRSLVLYFGSNYLKALKTYDFILKAPGIPSRILKPFLKRKQIVTSQTNLFFEYCPGTIIGVTGTKGKSTTSALIHDVLKAGGVQVSLIGNIEKPVLGFLEKATKNDVFVYELSSFQLETATRSPHIAVFLNLYAEHLDHHGTIKSYTKAKKNITKFQTKNDYFIFNQTDPAIRAIAASSKAQKIPFRPKLKRGSKIASSSEPARIVGKLFGIRDVTIRDAISRFKPLPHRLEHVGTLKGITFYNDSLATIPEATISALDILGSNVHTLIAGGFDRGIPMDTLAKRIAASKIKTLILLPTTGSIIWKKISALPTKHLPDHHFVSNMATAVELAYQYTPAKKICLLSPASSSFNLFSDYKERGEEFKKFAALYAKKKYS